MLTDAQTLIVYKGQAALVDMAYTIAEKRQYGENVKLHERYEAYKLMNLLEAIDDEQFLTAIQLDNILNCIKDISGSYAFGGIPLITNRRATIIQGGTQGTSGQPGTNGTDANINVVIGENEEQLAVAESVIADVKTYTLTFTDYSAPEATIEIQGNTTREVGVTIASLAATVSSTKGSKTITSRSITSPGGVSIDNTNINGVTQPDIVTVTKSAVTTNTTFTVSVSDGTTTVTDSDIISFYYPWFYGALSASSTTIYGQLSKVIEAYGAKSALYDDINKYFYIAFPESWAVTIDVIKDGHGSDVTSAFERLSDVSVTSTGLDVNWTVDYRIYRTTYQTTITNQTYTFTFTAD